MSHTCNRRAQAAVEMLAYAAFFFLVFVTAIAVFLQMQGQDLTRAENAYAQEIAYGFADNIHVAFVAGPGFSGSVSVPPDLLGRPYWLFVSRSPDAASQETGFVYVEWESSGRNASFSAPTVTASYKIKQTDNSGMVTYLGASSEFIAIDQSKGNRINISNEGGNITLMKG